MTRRKKAFSVTVESALCAMQHAERSPVPPPTLLKTEAKIMEAGDTGR